MQVYHDYLRHILQHGNSVDDRTGVGTISTFGHQMRFNLTTGFPLVTTKRVGFKSVASEILWMLSGSTSVLDLQAMGNHIWDPWADQNGELGPVYGHQWVAWPNPGNKDKPFTNQIQEVIESIKVNPYSRRHIVTAWNVSDVPFMRLPPCHMFFQFQVSPNPDLITTDDLTAERPTAQHLSCHMYIRSSDAFIGMPYNIAGYALLTYMIAHQTGLSPYELIISVGDAHIYKNHVNQVNEQLLREPRSLPRLVIHRLPPTIFEYTLSDFELVGYDPHDKIEAPIAV